MGRPEDLTADLKWLRDGASRSPAWLTLSICLFLLADGAFRLWMASLYAKLLGLSIAEGCHRWTAEMGSRSWYSTPEIKMWENFDAALVAALGVFFFAALGWISRGEGRRRARLAVYIDELSANKERSGVT